MAPLSPERPQLLPLMDTTICRDDDLPDGRGVLPFSLRATFIRGMPLEVPIKGRFFNSSGGARFTPLDSALSKSFCLFKSFVIRRDMLDGDKVAEDKVSWD